MGLDLVEGCHSSGLLTGLNPDFGKRALYTRGFQNSGVSSFVILRSRGFNHLWDLARKCFRNTNWSGGESLSATEAIRLILGDVGTLVPSGFKLISSAQLRSLPSLVTQSGAPMWEDSSYFWLVLCKNHWFHARKNFFFRHQILLAETDAFASRPPVGRPFKVRCDECGKEYVYKVTEVLRVEHEPPESFTPQPLFRDEADPYPGKSEPEKSQSNIGSPMQIERRRATRHLFGVAAEVINVESQAQITSLARDLNLYGCFVTSKAPFPKGTEVRLTITKSQTNFSAVGRVAFNLPDEGMGIAFAQVEPANQAVLEEWLAPSAM